MFILILILTTLLVPVIDSNNQTCYIKSASCLPPNKAPCYDWSNVTERLDHYTEVCKVLLFAPGKYFLNRTLLVNSDKNISFVGAGPHATNIVCLDQPSSFVVVNISMLKIMNISFINCGGIFENISTFVPRLYTTLLLHNVMSAEICNVVFNNSQGYVLFGVNLQSKLSLLNISIFALGSLRHTGDSKGIMILNFPKSNSTENHIRLRKCFVTIKNCKFYGMRSNTNIPEGYTNNSSSIQHTATAIGLVFHQQTIVNISNTIFANITSNNKPVVLISYLMDKPTFVTIINSIFININCIENSLVEVKFLAQPKSSSLHKSSFQNCTFSYNNATQLIQILYSDTAVNTNAPIKVKIQFLTTLFTANTVTTAIWIVNSNRCILNTSVLIADCSFFSNNVSDLRFEDIHSLTLNGINTFDGNFGEVLIYLSCIASFIMQGSATFSNNRVNILFYLSKYLILNANYSLLNITNNQIAKTNDTMQHHNFYLIYIIPDVLSPDICEFQISGCVKNVTSLNTSIIFQNNTGYQGPIYGYPFNNCKWDHYCNQSHNVQSSKIFENIIHYDQSNSNSITGKENSICYCESSMDHSIDCSKTKVDKTIYPGQTISIPLISTAFNSPVSVTSYNEEDTSVCQSVYHNICSPSPQLRIVYQSCTNLTYTIRSNSTDWCMLCFKTITQSKENTIYNFNITLKECPLGLIHYNESCTCNPKLRSAVKGLTCNSDGTLTRPPYTWISTIGIMYNMTDIVYSTECYMDYCSKSITRNLDLNDPDVQCSGNRSGILCGSCAKGFSAVFGTLRCMRCTNIWLLLIPVLALAGILLVWLLFTLNLTVVDGHIYGHILYVNILSLYTSRIFPSNYLLYFPLLMSNFDLGIEVCFYNGMTNYATTWLQFIFPVYVISLVIGLSFASRYSRMIEKLTRKRVIPVIATLYLLAYNKMMFMVAKGLFAYRTIHYFKLQKTETYWSLYTQIPLFGLEFIILFVFCILILVLLLLPTTILFLFPKSLLKYRLVAKYLKPFLDAYLAPFKDTCYHSLGVEMIIRTIIYGCDSLRADYTAVLYASIALFYLTYLSFQQPFKSSLNTILYSMYVCNIGCVAVLFTYYPISKPKMYTITFNFLVGVSFAAFLGIILLHIFKYCVHENASVMFSKMIKKCKEFFLTSHVHDDTLEREAINYVQYREDLLDIDPSD